VGLALGTIYALGAIQTFSQLWERNDLLYLFSLVPLTQILSKGIALAIAYALILVLTAILAGFFHFASRRRKRLSQQLREGDGLRTPRGKEAGFLAGISLVLLLVMALISLISLYRNAPWSVWAITPLGFAYFHFGDSWLVPRVGLVRAIAVLSIAFVLLVGVLGTIVIREPLPDLVLKLKDNSSIEGELVTTTPDTWVLIADDVVRIFPGSTVRTASLKEPPNAIDQRSLSQILGQALD